jgi:hypothetical protein
VDVYDVRLSAEGLLALLKQGYVGGYQRVVGRVEV